MIGIDLVYLPEFEKQIKVGGASFLQKAFNSSELSDKGLDHLAGLWAAKEAVIKASNSKLNIKEVIISYDKNGKPHAEAAGKNFEVSIAHHGEYAIAVAAGDKNDI